MNICEYCSKEFSCEFSLNNHIRRSKKCIINRATIPIFKHNCQSCGYGTMIKWHLKRHQNTCKKYKEIYQAK